MLSRQSLGRGAQRVIKRQCCVQLGRRGLATPASGSFQYQTGEANGVKFASRDLPGPTATLALVSKTGTRFEPAPGLTEALEKFAFTATERRSTLRIVRESELLGGEISANHSRENLVLGAKFLRDDLPYYVELLAEVAYRTKYENYILNEEVIPTIQKAHKKFLANVSELAINSAHGVAFHRGLGVPLYPASSTPTSKYITLENVQNFANSAFSKPNFAIVANGADQSELSKWVGEFFSDIPASGKAIESQQQKYYGGEERIAHGSGSAMVIAFSGSSSPTGGFYKPEIQVLASILGGKSSIKWSSGFSVLGKQSASSPGLSVDTKSLIYSDAGLLATTLQGPAEYIAKAAVDVVSTLKSIAGGDLNTELFKKAKAHAKFQELEFGQNVKSGLELTGSGLIQGGKAYQIDETAKAIDAVTESQVKTAAKQLLESKASVSSVGDLHQLPFAEELGLTV
ncbi:LuxS/MPP-like metallohydrolase [Pseudovirgaria hyperparasitica]|uniref:Cytochrome b-c1 complex subunit 2, mitochondrial n=1 Tax=Pseudovirgaria hyperparasitica TaxID=470096 RepID=A0A6A6W0J7_9PEZI|nr:LuxS/MPP-like metallohydrolase [Pseudovirgaria hyperparasitica]KAF2755616.1 LuxS/MPP-like metallohydrolase [Pseudovirgaria hyperparasitica]